MISTLSTSETNFLRAIEKIQARGDRAQLEVSSGKRIFSVSDEPDGISALLTVRAEIEANDQLKNNLGRTKAEVDAAENGLQQATKILERARTLAAQGQNGFNVESTWTALSLEAGDLTQQMLNVSNLAIEGRYIFSGNSDGNQPFDFDPGLNAVTYYNGSAATRRSLFPGGNPFDIARPGDVIFDNAGVDENGVSKSAFAALKSLKDALEARNPDQLRQALLAIESSAKNISNELSFYGATQRRVTEATAASEANSLRLRSQLSRLEDADLTEAIIESQQAQFQLQAAFQVRGTRRNQSLFDYIG
jgi:flagellar hook-associated protein 3 FlgL